MGTHKKEVLSELNKMRIDLYSKQLAIYIQKYLNIGFWGSDTADTPQNTTYYFDDIKTLDLYKNQKLNKLENLLHIRELFFGLMPFEYKNTAAKIIELIDEDFIQCDQNEKERYIFEILFIFELYSIWFNQRAADERTKQTGDNKHTTLIGKIREGVHIAFQNKINMFGGLVFIGIFSNYFNELLLKYGIDLRYYERISNIYILEPDIRQCRTISKDALLYLRSKVTSTSANVPPPQKTYWQLIDEIHGAKPFYERAIERGYITDNGDRLQWNKSKAELAYFAELVYIKALNQNKVPQTNLAAIFGEIGKRLDSAKNGYLNNKKLPKWQIQIDSDFGNLFTE